MIDNEFYTQLDSNKYNEHQLRWILPLASLYNIKHGESMHWQDLLDKVCEYKTQQYVTQYSK